MKVYPLILLILIVFSCTEKHEPLIIEINGNSKGPLQIGDFFEIEECIPLETNEQCLISKINQFKINDKNIYILDAHKSDMFVFDHTGSFKFKVGQKGKGPGEYINPMCFDINKNTLALFDNSGKILLYTLEGDFIKSFRTDFLIINAIKLLDNGNIALVASKTKPPFEIYILNNKGETINEFCEFDPKIDVSFSLHSIFDDEKGTSYCLPQFTSEIYKYSNNKFTTAYKINYTPELQAELCNHKIFDKSYSKIQVIYSIIKIKDSIIIYYSYDNKRRFAVYNQSTETTQNGTIKDRTFYRYAVPEYSKNDNAYGIVPAHYLHKKPLDQLVIKGKKNIVDELDTIAKKVKSSDNPVIVKYKLKNAN